MSTEHYLFLAAAAAFALAAVAYFHRWVVVAAGSAGAYMAACLWLCTLILWPQMPLVCAVVVVLGVGLPVVFVLLFAIDVWFGAFLLDMAYAMAFAWLLSPLAFAVTFAVHFLGDGAG